MNAARRILPILCWLAALPAMAQPAPTPSSPNDPAVVRAEAPIVAGNAVTAKKRALADAFRQAVERAFGDLVAQGGTPATPRLQQLKASLAGSGQKYIRRYRILEREEVAGQLKLMVEAEVETVLLRREIEKASAVAAPAPLPAKPSASATLVVGGTPADLLPPVRKAMEDAGFKVQANDSGDGTVLVTAAAKVGGTALLVSAQATGEGLVRGTDRISAQCVVGYHWLSPQASQPLRVGREKERGTGADEAEARLACLARASREMARGLADWERTPGVRAPFFTLALDAVEPGVLSQVVAALKRIGAVAATEVRTVSTANAELRIFTRLPPAALQPMLAREVAGKLTLATVGVGPDRLQLQARTPQHEDLVTPQGDR
jgi:hypothetical protein